MLTALIVIVIVLILLKVLGKLTKAVIYVAAICIIGSVVMKLIGAL